jgi:ADP-ribosylglycohydrolase
VTTVQTAAVASPSPRAGAAGRLSSEAACCLVARAVLDSRPAGADAPNPRARRGGTEGIDSVGVHLTLRISTTPKPRHSPAIHFLHHTRYGELAEQYLTSNVARCAIDAEHDLPSYLTETLVYPICCSMTLLPSRRASSPASSSMPLTKDRFLGCLFGAMIGDSLGCLEEEHLLSHRSASLLACTYDVPLSLPTGLQLSVGAQLLLFTCEGAIRTLHRSLTRGFASSHVVIQMAYMRWAMTQCRQRGDLEHAELLESWLIQLPRGWLWDCTEATPLVRQPSTCLSAICNETVHSSGDVDDAEALVRVAPCGLATGVGDAFRAGKDIMQLTHDAHAVRFAAGFFALVLQQLTSEGELSAATRRSLEQIVRSDRYPEDAALARQITSCLEYEHSSPRTDVAGAALGSVITGLHCAAAAGDFAEGIHLALDRGGPALSTTVGVAGAVLGYLHGAAAIAGDFTSRLPAVSVISSVFETMWTHFGPANCCSCSSYVDYPPC